MHSLLITVVTSSWPLGAVLGGLVSSKLIPAYGWEAVFYLGGILPLVLIPLLVLLLPESIRFMASRGAKPDQIAGILNAISKGGYSATDTFTVPEKVQEGFSPGRLFSEGRTLATVLLWVSFFMNFLVLFFIFNWLPPVLQQSGLPIERAIVAVVLFNLGGIVGGIVLGRLMDQWGQFRTVAWAYVFGALFVGSIAFAGFSIPLLMAVIALSGFCSVGTQVCGNALAAGLYPTTIRSTGVGWAYGIGRIGSIVGPLLGGVLLSLEWGMRDLFLIAAVPLLLAGLAIWLLNAVE
jgi:AAHS family 4-hydroxybenzoate transporter-like MFS transporter